MKTMTEATETFLKEADWLGPVDEPAVTALRKAAEALDDRFQAALLTQYRGLYNDLMNRKGPGTPEAHTEQDAFLQEIGL